MKTATLLIAVFAALGASCSSNDPSGEEIGGETHWLAACAQDVDCGNGELSCVCGSCTRACSTDAGCGGDKEAA